jgi:hypothetical protein
MWSVGERGGGDWFGEVGGLKVEEGGESGSGHGVFSWVCWEVQ